MRRTPAPLFAVALLMAALLGCNKPAEEKAAPATGAETEARVPVETHTTGRKTFVRRLVLPGQFEAVRTARLAVELPGRVLALPVEEGQPVQRDQVLIKLDPTSVRAQAAQAQAGVEQARAQLELARTTLARTEKLAAAKVVDAARLDQARIGKRQAAAALKLAQAAEELATATLRKTVVRAPFAGTLTQRTLEPGEVASPGPPQLVVSDFSSMKLVLQVPEQSVAQVQKGQEVTVRVSALGDETRTGTVARVPMQGDLRSRTYAVELAVPNADGRLRAGMSGTAELVLETLPDRVVVPLDGLVDEPPRGREPGRTVVFLAEGGKARRVVVKAGAMQGEEAMVESGLEGGEQLIVVGQRRVVDGDLISVVRRDDGPRKALEKAIPDQAAQAPKPVKGAPGPTAAASPPATGAAPAAQ